MKILVTGSNGIIGQQLLSQLLNTYPLAKFIVINRSTRLTENKRVKSIGLDLLNIGDEKVLSLFDDIRPDLFFHLAWDTGHKEYLTTLDNKKWEEISILLINNFYNSGGKRFIGIGSSIEYDWAGKSPFLETQASMNGNGWLYGQSKLNVYKYLTSLPNISYLWCRIFFVFGPSQGKTRLVPLIINNAINGGVPLTINLDLKRDYISTFETARQIIMMQKTNYSGAVNICSGRVIQLGKIVRIIEDHTNKHAVLSDVKFQDNFENESIGGNIDLIKKYYPDYSYSFEDFTVDLEETIDHINK